MLTRAIVIIVVVAGLLGALVYSQKRHVPLKVSGFIEADEIRVGSRVGGRVSKVAVAEGQAVKTGEPMVELEAFDLKERRAEAAQMLAAKRADFDRLSAGYRPE